MAGTVMRPVLFALAAAALYGTGLPLSKLLLGEFPPVALAGILYLGAFAGLLLWSAGRRLAGAGAAATPLGRRDYPWLAGSVLTGGLAAPVLLMGGLAMTAGFAASLLSSLEGVFTAVLAVSFFGEHAGKRVALAVALTAAGSALVSYDPAIGASSALGPVLIALSMLCWGLDNNLTRNISGRDGVQIALVKSLVAGAVPLAAAVMMGFRFAPSGGLVLALVVGALGYGASLLLFIRALEGLGSSRTAALFSTAPLIAAVASVLILREWLGWVMLPAALLSVAGAVLLVREGHEHAHRHGSGRHAHLHRHDELHHGHHHPAPVPRAHSHEHSHDVGMHSHPHAPDTHHRHPHAASAPAPALVARGRKVGRRT